MDKKNSMTNLEKIKNFILDLQKTEGQLPKFCHNLNGPKNKVYYSGPFIDENELASAIETLLFGKWSSSGETCAIFEKEFSKKINQKKSFFTNSGSSANLLLIASCKEYFKWQNEDEIIVSAVGFPTTVSAIIQNNLKPIFIDIEQTTLNFDLELIEEKITSKTKAIFLSPVLGNPPNIDALIEICQKHNLQFLLDNCDSLGTKWKNKFLNEYAVASSCSFYPAHEITTLEGGMVSSNIEEIVSIARSYATWGRDCWCVGSCNLLPNGSCNKRFSNWLEDFPEIVIDHKYIFNRIGYNLKPLDLQAAIGIEQLKKLDYICHKRQTNQKAISQLFLKYIKNIKLPLVHQETNWIPFGVPIVVLENKNKLVKHLEKNGIQTRNYFAGNLLMHKGYKYLDNYKKYPESNKVLNTVFFIGCAPTISEDNIKYIEETLANYEN
jgi:CDP-6-deoxy-D-xylo-4-hexulose-3-dehydrase